MTSSGRHLPLFTLFRGGFLKEDIIKLVGEPLTPLNMHIDDVIYIKQGKQSTLDIVLDSDESINIDRIVETTHIISPLLDKKE